MNLIRRKEFYEQIKKKKKEKKRCNDEFFMIKVKMSLDSIHLFFFYFILPKIKIIYEQFPKNIQILKLSNEGNIKIG